MIILEIQWNDVVVECITYVSIKYISSLLYYVYIEQGIAIARYLYIIEFAETKNRNKIIKKNVVNKNNDTSMLIG